MQKYNDILDILMRNKMGGCRTLSTGNLLIGHVPHVGSGAYFHIIYSPLTLEQVNKLEQEIKVTIPDQYKEFLTSFSNGLSIFSSSIELYGLRLNNKRTGEDMYQPFHIKTSNTFERTKGASEDVLFIGSYKYDGSKLYVDSKSTKVYRCERYSMTVLNEWNSLNDMLLSEISRLSDHFDGMGQRIDKKRPTTP